MHYVLLKYTWVTENDREWGLCKKSRDMNDNKKLLKTLSYPLISNINDYLLHWIDEVFK